MDNVINISNPSSSDHSSSDSKSLMIATESSRSCSVASSLADNISEKMSLEITKQMSNKIEQMGFTGKEVKRKI